MVIVEFTWNASSPRNGPFNYNLSYTADQTPPYPQERRFTGSNSLILSGERETTFTIESALPFAIYNVTIFAFNIRLGLPGVGDTASIRSEAVGEFSQTVSCF